MSLKISKALFIDDGSLIKPSEYENRYGHHLGDKRPKIVCPTKHCAIRLSFVSGNEARRSHFRRREKTIDHVSGCPFNMCAAIAIVAHESEGLIEKHLNSGKKVFRLNIPHKDNIEPLSMITEALAQDPTGSPLGMSVTYINYGKKKDPHISTLNKLWLLRQSVETCAELSQELIMKWHDANIEWRHLYYDWEHYPACLDYINSRTYSKKRHPVCLEGEIKSVRLGSGSLSLELVAYIKKRPPLFPWVNINNPDIAERIRQIAKEGSYMLAYGDWEVKVNRKGIVALRLKVKHPHQVLFLNE